MQTAFLIRANGKFCVLSFEEILYIKGKGNYCEFITTNQKKYLTYGTIGAIEPQLPENLFCRIHKSHIVPIKKIQQFDHSTVQIGPIELPLSRAGFEQLLKRLLIIDSNYGNKKDEMRRMSVEDHVKKPRKKNGEDNTK
jgi:DNA-binding LytR/AlgR family response regulator